MKLRLTTFLSSLLSVTSVLAMGCREETVVLALMEEKEFLSTNVIQANLCAGVACEFSNQCESNVCHNNMC